MSRNNRHGKKKKWQDLPALPLLKRKKPKPQTQIKLKAKLQANAPFQTKIFPRNVCAPIRGIWWPPRRKYAAWVGFALLKVCSGACNDHGKFRRLKEGKDDLCRIVHFPLKQGPACYESALGSP